MSPRQILVLGFGNPGRLDDGLGPALAERVERAGLEGVSVLTEYQLNIEHAADIAGHEAVILADAAATGPEPCSFRRLLPRRATTFSTHAVPPEAVLALARDSLGWRGAAYILAIRGHRFDGFGESLSARALANLAEAAGFLLSALRSGRSLDDAATDEPTADTLTLRNGGEPCKTASP